MKEPRALQHRLRHQFREAEAEAAVNQDRALSMLAAEVAADQRCTLQQHLHHQQMEAKVEAVVSQVGGYLAPAVAR